MNCPAASTIFSKEFSMNSQNEYMKIYFSLTVAMMIADDINNEILGDQIRDTLDNLYYRYLTEESIEKINKKLIKVNP
jgi:hypothetical protein